MSDVREVIVIGSGPTGYTAAVYTARANLAPLVFTGSVEAGGALMNTTEVENFPGFPEGIMGPDLMMNMRAQAERFGAELIEEDVVEVDLTGPIKVVKDANGDEYRAKAVILAMGSGYRHLHIPGEDKLSGKGVSWCATCDGFFFRNKNIAVIGGGDSAVEEATFLSRFGDTVTMIVRRDELRASKIMAERAAADPKISIVWDSVPETINGENNVTSLTVRNVKTDETTDIPVQGVFVAIGHDPRSQLVNTQIPVDAEGYVQVIGRTTHTAIDGVFACGDLVDNRYRQAITAAGSGCAAALDAQRWLESPEER